MDLINQQNRLIQEAEACLTRIKGDLAIIVDESNFTKISSDEAEIESLRTLQLVLQYRLDTQSALQRLFLINQNLAKILGVSPHHSVAINMERLNFALGSDDLHQALAMLSQLIDALLRVLHRYSDKTKAVNVSLNRKQLLMRKPPSQSSRLYKTMIKIVEKQKSFNFILDQLDTSLEKVLIEGDTIYGPILDHIGQLDGPVYLFYNALRHGLVVSGGIYQRLQVTSNFNKKMDELLAQANSVLDQSHRLVERPQLFRPSKEISSTQELDARAAEKRLGRFFYHPV